MELQKTRARESICVVHNIFCSQPNAIQLRYSLHHWTTEDFIWLFFHTKQQNIILCPTSLLRINYSCLHIYTPPAPGQFFYFFIRCGFGSNSRSVCVDTVGLFQSCTSGHCNVPRSYLRERSSSVRLHGVSECEAFFKSTRKFSIGLRSGLWLGYSRTSTVFFKPFL